MKPLKFLLISAIAVLLLEQPAVSAEYNTIPSQETTSSEEAKTIGAKRFCLFLEGGASTVPGKEDELKTGPAYNVGFEYWPVNHFGIELSFLWTNHRYEDSLIPGIATGLTGMELENEYSIDNISIGTKIGLLDKLHLQPWIGTDVALYTKSLEGELEGADLELNWDDVGVNAGGGIDYVFPSGFTVGINGRYHWIFDEESTDLFTVFFRIGISVKARDQKRGVEI